MNTKLTSRRRFLTWAGTGFAASMGAFRNSVSESAIEKSLVFRNVEEWGVEGKGWSEVERYYDRLPSRAKGLVREPEKKEDRAKEGEPYRFQVDLQITVEAYSLSMAGKKGVRRRRPWKETFEVTYVTPPQVNLKLGQRPEDDRQAIMRAGEKFAEEFWKTRDKWMKD